MSENHLGLRNIQFVFHFVCISLVTPNVALFREWLVRDFFLVNLTTDLVSFLKKSLAENFIFKQWNTYFSGGKKISQQYLNSYCENTKIDTSVLLKLFVRELNFNQVYLVKTNLEHCYIMWVT